MWSIGFMGKLLKTQRKTRKLLSILVGFDMVVITTLGALAADVGDFAVFDGDEVHEEFVGLTTVASAMNTFDCCSGFHRLVRMSSRQPSFLGHCFRELMLEFGIEH